MSLWPPLPGELSEFGEVVGAFATERLAGYVADAERADRLPGELYTALAEQGYSTLGMAADHGGSGADLLAVTVAVQRLATVSAAAATAVAQAHLAYATAPEPPVAELAASGRLAVLVDASPDAGDAVELSRAGEVWTVRGRAGRVEAAGDAALFVVADERAGALLIDPAQPGVVVEPPLRRTGLRGLAPHPVSLDRVHAGTCLSGALSVAHRMRSVLLGAVACGLAEAAWSAARGYAATRRQFGKQLLEFGALAGMLDDMATELASCLAVLTSAARGGDSPGAGVAARRCAQCAVSVADRAIQVHGGYGYLAEYPVERFLRDAVTVRALLAGGGRAPAVGPGPAPSGGNV